jgi:hypothetical protein
VGLCVRNAIAHALTPSGRFTLASEEEATPLRLLHGLFVETLGRVAEASYIVIHELPAQSYGCAQ